MQRVGFLGTGTIAAAMVHGLAGLGHRILVSERNAGVARRLVAEVEGVAVAANAGVVEGSDTVLVCLLADVAREVLPRLSFRPEQAVISVAADLPLADLRALCAPATNIAIAIPLPTIALPGSPVAVFPEAAALSTLFGDRVRLILAPSEQALNAHFAITGVLLPLFDQLQASADWLALQTGDPSSAEAYVIGLVGSYFRKLAAEPDLDLAAIRSGLSTEGGLNQTLSRQMEERGALSALVQGLDGLARRLGLPE